MACRIAACWRLRAPAFSRSVDNICPKTTSYHSALLRRHQPTASPLHPHAPSTLSHRSTHTSQIYPITPFNSFPRTHFSTSSHLSENPNDVYTNPYKAKRIWPPDVSKLSPKQQFRLERKYRRRAKLKWARPSWKKWTTLIQWGLIGFVLIYAVFFMELKEGGENPFQGLRTYVRNIFNESFWSNPRGALRRGSNADIPEKTSEEKQV